VRWPQTRLRAVHSERGSLYYQMGKPRARSRLEAAVALRPDDAVSLDAWAKHTWPRPCRRCSAGAPPAVASLPDDSKTQLHLARAGGQWAGRRIQGGMDRFRQLARGEPRRPGRPGGLSQPHARGAARDYRGGWSAWCASIPKMPRDSWTISNCCWRMVNRARQRRPRASWPI